MKTKGHGTIKKSKAYGAIGTLLLSGILVAAMGTTAVQADETVENSSATETLASTPQVATESTAATATDSEVSVGDTKTSETEANKTVISDSAESTTPVEVEKTTETSSTTEAAPETVVETPKQEETTDTTYKKDEVTEADKPAEEPSQTPSTTENTDAEVVKPAESTVPEKTETEAASATSVPEKTETEVAGVTTEATNVVEENENNSTESTEAEEDSTEPAKEMASTEATSEESSAEELVASETEAKVISEDAEAADQSKHGATGGGTGVTDRVTDVYLGSNGFNIQYNQPIADGAKIMFAVWSDKNGQDDLIWYTADSHGKTTAKYTGSYGKYHIHTYQNLNGKMTCISATSIDMPKPDVKVSVTQASDTSAKVVVTNVPIYVHDIEVPVWTSQNGQDDIKWYKAEKAADGSYTYTFYAKNHNFESGHYNVHVYGVSEVTHSFVGLATTSGIDLTFNQNLTAPTVTVQNHNADKGTLQVVIAETETSKSIASLSVAAWSEAEQKNIHWYTTSNLVDGSTTVTVDEKYHHNLTGNYTVHTYIKTKDGSTIGYNLGQYAFNNTQAATSVTATYKGTGVYGVTISGVYSNGSVKYAIWSDVNGQDDIKWYDASVSQAIATGLINVANHSGTGTYHLHAYQSDNGKMYLLGKTEFTMKKTSYNTPYYN